MSCQGSLLLLVLLTSCSAQHIYYVAPTPDTPCPGEPCHTLSQYVADNGFKNLPVKAKIEFLPGNHTLEKTISMQKLTQLTLHGDSSFLPEDASRIVCTWPAGFVFTDITELHITALAFTSCGHRYSAAVIIKSVQQSNISSCSFHNSRNENEYDHDGYEHDYCFGNGGALCVETSTLNLTRNTFLKNSALTGGALYVKDSSNLILSMNTFQNNSAQHGGALNVVQSRLNLTRNTFQNNSAAAMGGAIKIQESSFLTLIGATFQQNTAGYGGGALSIRSYSTLILIGTTFQRNSAEYGGAVYIMQASKSTITGSTFEYNHGKVQGGALFVTESCSLNLTGNTFQNNFATELGGNIYIVGSSMIITNNNFTRGSAEVGGIIAATNSCVRMYETNGIRNSRAQYGAAIAALDSQLNLTGNTAFENNTASYGGGLYVHNTIITGKMTLANNLATEGGGGVYASNSTFYFTGNTTIVHNSAVDGGGLLLSGQSQFYLQPNTHVHFISNSAKSTGGAIKVAERNPLTYCTLSSYSDSRCFFQIKNQSENWNDVLKIKKIIDNLNVRIHFDNNSAIRAGADLHGGSVDNCTLSNIQTLSLECNHCPTSGNVFDDVAITISKITPGISSDPLHICACRNNLVDCTGSYHHPDPVYAGAALEVPVIAHGQRKGTTPAIVQVINTSKSSITIPQNENIQNANNSCTTLKYTIQSSAENITQNMTLYAKGPCTPSQTNTLTITVDILYSPPGFQLLSNQTACTCAERLQHFTDTCLINNKTVLRRQDAEFWVGYDSRTHGLILHPHCPLDYCTSGEVYLAANDSDKQCNYNRSGLLCGKCSENLSLSLGSSRCLQCSNSYLTILVAFIFAGIALVVLLLVLRLTVAAGTINGLIFYANIITVNSAIFFQPQVTNVLTVFVAWLNLDLGIETCFYNGMDAYIKTWLQFTFPIYVWALVGMIIFGSHYSGRITRMFGSNPVAVLATLFLLSYAKLLRTVIAELSYTFLEYPNNSQIAVWLYDGNIRYLGGKHTLLFTAAMVCLIFLFLPYTMLLIFSQCLQAKSELKIFSCINSHYVKPFLDAYHAPYSNKYRYWTGLMLLLRLVLFLISAVNASGDPNINLLSIASTTTLILPIILGSRIYKTWSLGFLETSFMINLTILAVATLYIRLTGGNQNAATFISVGVAFATFTGIVIYHSAQQLKGTWLWRRVCLRHDYTRVPLTDVDSGLDDPPDSVFVPGAAPTKTVVDIHEPCTATD